MRAATMDHVNFALEEDEVMNDPNASGRDKQKRINDIENAQVAEFVKPCTNDPLRNMELVYGISTELKRHFKRARRGGEDQMEGIPDKSAAVSSASTVLEN